MDDTNNQKRKYIRVAPTKAVPQGFTKKGLPRKRRSSDQVKKGLEVIKKPAIQRREKPDNYLKYLNLVLEWAKRRYKVSMNDLGMIFFLYDEDVFHKTKFMEYGNIMPMNKYRLDKMIKDGWIRCWRSDEDHRYKLYELTSSAKRIVSSIKNKLEGREKISEFESSNEIMKRTNTKDKIYSIAIKKMNKRIDDMDRRMRHPTRTDWGKK